MSRDTSGRSAPSRAKLGAVIAAPALASPSDRPTVSVYGPHEHVAQLHHALGVVWHAMPCWAFSNSNSIWWMAAVGVAVIGLMFVRVMQAQAENWIASAARFGAR